MRFRRGCRRRISTMEVGELLEMLHASSRKKASRVAVAGSLYPVSAFKGRSTELATSLWCHEMELDSIPCDVGQDLLCSLELWCCHYPKAAYRTPLPPLAIAAEDRPSLIRWCILYQRNTPSVFMWSVGLKINVHPFMWSVDRCAGTP
jgi:hypothetical protein